MSDDRPIIPGGLTPPHGRDQANDFYGWNPHVYMTDEGRPADRWERDQIVSLRLVAPMSFIGKPVRSIRVHKRLVGVFAAVYDTIFRAGLWHVVVPYAGAYEFRLIRGGDELSMHAFGAAVDHDPARNPLGAPPERCRFGNAPEGAAVVSIFESFGFTWGGTFRGRKDCMHFQFGSGV